MRISESEYNDLHSWVKDYIKKYCITFKRGMPGKLPGTQYTWIIYLRRGLFNPDFLSAISQMFIYQIDKHEIPWGSFQISGLETAATPMLAGIPLIAKAFDISLNAFVVRKEQKEYGLMNWIEGMPNDLPVIIIDDLCNSSTSMQRCKHIIEAHDLIVNKTAFAIVNKSNRGQHSEARLNGDMYANDLKVISLFTLDDLGLSGTSH